MEIKTREELIKCWNDNIIKYKDEEPKVFLSKIEEYLKFIKENISQDDLLFALSSISKIHIDEFKKEREFGQILECVKNFTLPSSTKTDYLFIVLELVHNKLITYNTDEINNILKAYKEIFNTLKDGKELTDKNGKILKEDLIEYLDLDKERKRDYSVITSNFLMGKDNFLNKLKKENGVYEAKLLEISKGLNDLNEKRKKLEKEEFFEKYFKKDLFSYVKKSPIGSSIGIDPLTDDLLLRSFESEEKDIFKKNVIIILGRDSYPCFHIYENKLYHSFQPPLYNYSMYNHKSFYKLFGTKDKDKKIEVNPIIVYLMKNHIFLFLNLYPDFRPEFQTTSRNFIPDGMFVKIANKAGYTTRKNNLDNCFDYCTKRFESTIQIIQNNLNIKAIISLGRPVANGLVRTGKIYENDEPKKDVVLALGDKPVLKYKSETLNINYIPIYHPTISSYFTKDYNDKYFEILGKI